MRRTFFAGLCAAALLAACAGGPQLRQFSHTDTPVELAGVPFFAQEDHQCGPAALATVLAYNGVAVTPEQLVPQIFIPGREGSLQLELLAASRRHARIPYVLQPDLAALLAEIAAGRPVLVLQNLGLESFPLWHYAVVIGFDLLDNTLLLRSGRQARQLLSARRFESSWARAGRWGLVITKPAEIPATAQTLSWLGAAAAFEALGRPQLALPAYEAATRRWPGQANTWLALGNARYAGRDLRGAAEALRRSLELAPSAAGYNNFAQVLLEQQCVDAASAAIAKARSLPAPDPIRDALERTAAAIGAYAGPRSDCPFPPR